MLGNVDGSPGFVVTLPPHKLPATGLRVQDFTLNPAVFSAALHAGNPDTTSNNPDGTRNTLGFTGGPDAE